MAQRFIRMSLDRIDIVVFHVRIWHIGIDSQGKDTTSGIESGTFNLCRPQFGYVVCSRSDSMRGAVSLHADSADMRKEEPIGQDARGRTAVFWTQLERK